MLYKNQDSDIPDNKFTHFFFSTKYFLLYSKLFIKTLYTLVLYGAWMLRSSFSKLLHIIFNLYENFSLKSSKKLRKLLIPIWIDYSISVHQSVRTRISLIKIRILIIIKKWNNVKCIKEINVKKIIWKSMCTLGVF